MLEFYVAVAVMLTGIETYGVMEVAPRRCGCCRDVEDVTMASDIPPQVTFQCLQHEGRSRAALNGRKT